MRRFTEFGKKFPKSHKLSPDSFCQLAFQLSYYKLHRHHPPTYETGTLRTFTEGRTDTIRLPSRQSAAFVESMVDDPYGDSPTRKAQLLRTAVAAHKEYTAAACSGNGMDRHLLGLRLAAQEAGVEPPAFLQHPTYTRLMRFNVATSQVPTKHDAMMCFGPTAEDCYGVCYNPHETRINFAVSTYDKPGYDAETFSVVLFESLAEMRDVLSLAQQSKL